MEARDFGGACAAGFGELSQTDQIKLIKQGSFEVAFIRYTKLFDEDGMMVPTMEYKVPRYLIKLFDLLLHSTCHLSFEHNSICR